MAGQKVICKMNLTTINVICAPRVRPRPFAKKVACAQSNYREVPQWEISMEQELRFGLDLGWIWAEFPAFIASKYFDL